MARPEAGTLLRLGGTFAISTILLAGCGQNADKCEDPTNAIPLGSNPEGAVRDCTFTEVATSNPKLVTSFQEKMNTVLDREIANITDASLIPGYYQNTIHYDRQDLADLLEYFSMNGVDFRKLILYAEETGHAAEASVLLTQYNFAREALQGKEFSIFGTEKTIINYKIGDFVEIDDYEFPERPGIFLRETATLTIDPERHTVRDGSRIKITSGPEIIINHINAKAVRMWRVQRLQSNAEGRLIPQEDETGWISEEWLGALLSSQPLE